MAESFELPVLRTSIEKLLDGESTTEEFLNDIFNDKDQEHKAILANCLESYYYGQNGSPEVSDFELTSAIFHRETSSGEFECEYTVYFYFPCDDMKTDKEDTMTWKFKIDIRNRTISFTGEEHLEREPDAY